MILGLIPSDGSDDSRFAMCAAEASSPSMSSLPSIDVSSTSNPVSFPKIVIRHFSGFRIQRNSNTTMFQSSEYLEQFFD